MKAQAHYSALALAVAATLGTAVGGQAQATPLSTTKTGNFNAQTAPVGYDNSTSGSNTDYNVPAGTVDLPSFNSATGVLTGANLSLSSTRTQTVNGTVLSGGKSGTNEGTVTGDSTAQLSAPGITSQGFNNIEYQHTGTNSDFPSTSSPTSTDTASPLGVSSSNLNSYVGSSSSTVSNIDLTAPSLKVSTSGVSNVSNTLNWDGSLSATYSYLLHADPSFSGSDTKTSLTLDFGTVNKNSSVGSKSFSLYNDLFSNGPQVGLALTGISPAPGNSSALSTNLAIFSDLSSGNSKGYTASFDTSNVGSFSNTYTLALADVNPGNAATDSLQNYTMTLNLQGTVQAPTPPTHSVPAPGSLVIMATGLLGLAGIRRRRHR